MNNLENINLSRIDFLKIIVISIKINLKWFSFFKIKFSNFPNIWIEKRVVSQKQPFNDTMINLKKIKIEV